MHLCQTTRSVLFQNCSGRELHQPVIAAGNAGYKLSWATNPHPPPFWSTVALEHGFLRCDVNGTTMYCEVRASILYCVRCHHVPEVISPALLLLMQEVSSMTGRVLDSWVLQKPAKWQPDVVVRNLFEQYFISNYTETDFLEKTGASPMRPVQEPARVNVHAPE